MPDVQKNKYALPPNIYGPACRYAKHYSNIDPEAEPDALRAQLFKAAELAEQKGQKDYAKIISATAYRLTRHLRGMTVYRPEEHPSKAEGGKKRPGFGRPIRRL